MKEKIKQLFSEYATGNSMSFFELEKKVLALFDEDDKSFCSCSVYKPNYPEMVWCNNCGKEINYNKN